MTSFGLANLDTHHPVGTPDALLPGQYQECLRARMSMHGRYAARRAAGFVDPEEILRCDDPGDRSKFGALSSAR